MKKKLIKLTESDLHRIIENSVKRIMNETDCGFAMQSGVDGKGGENPSAGQYEAPFLSDKETKKRNKDFKNGSISMQRNESTDVISKPIYKPFN